VVRDETSMPTQERVGLHDEDRPPVATNDARQGSQEQTVGGFESGSWHLTVQDRELMSQNKDLGVFGAVASSAKHEKIQHQADKTVEGVGHARILSPCTNPHASRETPAQEARTSFRHPQASATTKSRSVRIASPQDMLLP
jgi:hypothetical protein